MLSISFLRQVLRGEISQITDVDKQVIESAAGYDGIVSLVQTKGITPIIVLEHNSTGELSVRPGGFERANQSIWIMKMVGRDEDRATVQAWCKATMKRFVSVMVKHYHAAELQGWQPESMPYSIRNAGANFTGYEFTMNFDEDIDLEYHGQE